jgi:hypothetical protein
MGEAKRRAAAEGQRIKVGDAELIGFAREGNSPFNMPRVENAACIVCEIATKGQITRDLVREGADWTAKSLDTQPGVLLILTVGGYDDDPREVLDIPEARQAFRWFGERLQELDIADDSPRLLNRLDKVSRELTMIAMGLMQPATINYNLTWPKLMAQLDEDADRVREADARYRAEQAAKAAQGGRQ